MLLLNTEYDLPHTPCDYYDSDQFNSFNLRRKVLKETLLFLSFCDALVLNFRIFVLVETWLNSETDRTFDISLVYTERFCGGIKIYSTVAKIDICL